MSQIFYIHVIGIIIIFTAELSFSDNVFIMVQTSNELQCIWFYNQNLFWDQSEFHGLIGFIINNFSCIHMYDLIISKSTSELIELEVPDINEEVSNFVLK